ncbi:MAG: MFS transporter [Acidobacteria bacterium]|nr:MFS transporter [Acidobacteriota bacterium]
MTPAVRFIVLLGLISLLADVTYEGARSVLGPYLATLGASAAVVGTVAGAGEFLGYTLRLVSGYAADRTRRYWTLTIAGYVINLLAVPAMALAGSWHLAAVLIILERAGKAIRTPSRDAMLSHATSATGRGWGFGLHEAMDQTGALLGPLLVAFVYARTHQYSYAFAILTIPAALAILTLLTARRIYPDPRNLEVKTAGFETDGLPRAFWLSIAAAGCLAAGYADFALVAYHFKRTALMPDTWIPLLYAVAMGVDATTALGWGKIFDRFGIPVLMLTAALSAAAVPMLFLGGFSAAVAGMALWGMGMGAQQSILKAAIAGMAPAARRGAAYGIFNTGYGISWFAGSALLGLLYDRSVMALVAVSVMLQLASIPVFGMVHRSLQRR